jgi:hypothetical protein
MHICDLIAAAGIGVAVVSLIFAYRQWSYAKELATDFDRKRSLFVGYLHGRKSRKLTEEERVQVDDMLARFDALRWNRT